MFDFRLKVFYTVALRMSFTRAATELFISQPAVTRHIRKLEEQFHQKLFERKGNKIALTPGGEILLRHVQQLFALHRKMHFDMNALISRHQGDLRLGASTTIAQYVIPSLLSKFHKTFPDVKIQLINGNTRQIEDLLLKKEIELGIIEGFSKNPNIKYTRFLKDEIVLVGRRSSPWVKQDNFSAVQLKQIPLLIREYGSGTLDVLTHHLKKYGILLSDLNIEMQLGSTESIKNYLKQSNSLAFLSINSIRAELESNELKMLPSSEQEIYRFFNFIYLQGNSDPLAADFIRFTQKEK